MTAGQEKGQAAAVTVGSLAGAEHFRTNRSALVRALSEAGANISGDNVNCPFHEDKNPSGAIYLNDNGAFRFQCFPCSLNLDAIEVLRRAKGWGFAESVRFLNGGNGSPTKISPPKPKQDWAALADQYAKAISHDKLRELAKTLGVTEESLQRLGAGWDRGAWVFPMKDATGTTIGIRRRLPSGKKLAIKGSRSGLFIPSEITGKGPLLVTEGESDCAAALDLAFDAVGRGACRQGGALLAEFCNGREVVIVGDCDGPGRAGAEALAAKLAATGLVKLTFPPQEHGDLRAWVQAGATADDLIEAISAAQEYKRNAGAPAIHTGEHLTDLGNARRLVALFGDDFRWCQHLGMLYWDGRRWAKDSTGAVERMAKEAVRGIYAEAANDPDVSQRKALASWATRSESATRLRDMVALARSEPGVPVIPDQLDAGPMLLNVLNGTIDLRSGELRPHDRPNLITKIAPVTYSPDAECPLFDAFLDRILDGKQDLIQFMQRAFGYSLTGDISEQIILILWGAGSNGKSVLLDTLRGIMGYYATKAAPDLLMVKRNESHPTEIADLFGKRMVVASETEEGRRLRTQFVKDSTGDEYMKGRWMRRDFFEFRRTHKTWLATNSKPVIHEQNWGLWRRIRLCPFSVVIPDGKQDRQLTNKLRREWNGILRWGVEGCMSWQRDGLGMPDAVRAATGAYRSESDVLGAFLADCCTLIPEARAASKDLYRCYSEWCSQGGERPLSQTAFGLRLQERGHRKCRIGAKNRRGWAGVGLLTPTTATGLDPECRLSALDAPREGFIQENPVGGSQPGRCSDESGDSEPESGVREWAL